MLVGLPTLPTSSSLNKWITGYARFLQNLFILANHLFSGRSGFHLQKLSAFGREQSRRVEIGRVRTVADVVQLAKLARRPVWRG